MSVPTIKAPTELTLETREDFSAAFRAALGASGCWIVVDLSATVYIDSGSLGRLLGLSKVCRDRGGEMLLTSASDDIAKVFETARLNEVFFMRKRPSPPLDGEEDAPPYLELLK
jgi:anti-anti-sigma factor